MKTFFSQSLSMLCLGSMLTLGACATSHPVASNSHRADTAGGTASGSIPTKDGRNSQYVAGNTVGGATGQEYSVPTGSQIPRHYNRQGYTTDNPDPSFVYDQNDIRVQSQNDVSDGLRSVPGVNVGGPR